MPPPGFDSYHRVTSNFEDLFFGFSYQNLGRYLIAEKKIFLYQNRGRYLNIEFFCVKKNGSDLVTPRSESARVMTEVLP